MNKLATRKSMRSATGFTLVELMVTLAILSVVVVLAAPNFSAVIKDNKMRSTANDLFGLIKFARTEAVREGVPIHVGPASTGVVVVWKDENSDNTYTNETIIRQVSLDGDISVTLNPNVAYMVFDGQGFISTQTSLSLCDDRSGETGREITVLVSGVSVLKNKVCS